jgi:hypothetical protein
MSPKHTAVVKRNTIQSVLPKGMMPHLTALAEQNNMTVSGVVRELIRCRLYHVHGCRCLDYTA